MDERRLVGKFLIVRMDQHRGIDLEHDEISTDVQSAIDAEIFKVDALADLPQVIMAIAQDRAIDGRLTEGGLERWVIWDDRGALDEALAKIGRTRVIAMTAQDAQSALAIVSRTDMAALAPRRLATAFAQQYDLKLFEPPYRSPVIDIEALWRRDLGASAAIDWLRSRLRAAAARL